VIPERLDGRRQVGPLQSLAGARPYDDVIVSLEQVRVDRQPGAVPTLRVGRPPIQTTGRYRGLVQLLGQDRFAGPDRFRVRHYDRRTGRFSGTIDSLRIPRQPLDRRGRRMFDPEGLLNSPAGRQGWYVYGAPDAAGVFTVQALQPRALMRIQADRRLVGTDRGLDYLLHHQWERTPRQRGRMERIEILPDPLPDGADPSPSPHWRLGDQALVLHLFGEVGGPLGDMAIIDYLLVPGHFALGLARVVSDPFTGEPVFDIRYSQLYTQMSEGIVSGTIDWPAFAGNLQRGWVGLRPFSDVLVALPWLSDLQLGSLRLSPLRELAVQEEVLMARYRSGDGTGFTDLTVTQSCVQDSAQALYITLQNLRRRVMDDATLAAWLKAHPEAPESRRHARLSQLAAAILEVLTWAGSVRPDWDHNAARMADPTSFRSDGRKPFRRPQFMDLLSSRRVVMPRRAHEELSTLFLRNGSGLWVLRTNQIPGGDTTVEPMAPTLLDP
jgi:predicted Abi (CAAX) family protease